MEKENEWKFFSTGIIFSGSCNYFFQNKIIDRNHPAGNLDEDNNSINQSHEKRNNSIVLYSLFRNVVCEFTG